MNDGQLIPPITSEVPENQLVDVITYTASLISDIASINPLLDTLRQVTARNHNISEFSEQDKTNLQNLQQKLEKILVDQEQFRTFSYETLHIHIRRHFNQSASRTTKLLTWWIVGIAATAILAAAASFTLVGQLQNTARSAISLGVFYMILDIGTATLLASARGEVTSEVRQTYGYLSGAMLCIAAITPVQPLLGIFAAKSPLAPTIMVATLGLARLPFYLSARKLALVTRVQSRLTSYVVIAIVGTCAVPAYALVALLTAPFRSGPLTTPFIVAVSVSHGLILLNSLISARLLAKARSQVSFLYARSITALMQVFIYNIFVCIYFLIYWYTGHDIGSDSLYLDFGAIALIGESVLFVRAAYLFKKTHLS